MAGRPNLSRETRFSGANGDREIFILSVQLTTSRFGNLTRLIRTLLIYIHAVSVRTAVPVHMYIIQYVPQMQQ